MQRETRFKERVLRDLRTLPNTYAEKIQQRAIRGTPDILACIAGFFVALELKVKGGRVDPLQVFVLDKIKAAGGVAMVVDEESWPGVLEKLRLMAETESDTSVR